MGSALQLVFVLDSIFGHSLTHDLPGFAEDAEVTHEFLMQMVVPEVHTVLVGRLVLLFGLLLVTGLLTPLAQFATNLLLLFSHFRRN